MHRISSPIAFLLLLVLPLQMQMGCTTTRVRQLDRPQKYPSTLQEGQKVRVHYTDKNENKQLLEGSIKEVAGEAVVITHRPSGTTLKHIKIPYQRIHKIEIVNKELNVGKTILEIGKAQERIDKTLETKKTIVLVVLSAAVVLALVILLVEGGNDGGLSEFGL